MEKELKECSTCGGLFTKDMFYNRHASCKECSKKNRVKRYHASPKRRVMELVCRAKNRKNAGKFDLDEGWVEKRLSNFRCEVTGRPFEHKGPFKPSLERIDPSAGYTKSNTLLVCYMYNVCKNKFSHEDVIEFSKEICRAEGYVVLSKIEV